MHNGTNLKIIPFKHRSKPREPAPMTAISTKLERQVNVIRFSKEEMKLLLFPDSVVAKRKGEINECKTNAKSKQQKLECETLLS